MSAWVVNDVEGAAVNALFIKGGFGSVELWHCGVEELWNCGVVIFSGSVELWSCGVREFWGCGVVICSASGSG